MSLREHTPNGSRAMRPWWSGLAAVVLLPCLAAPASGAPGPLQGVTTRASLGPSGAEADAASEGPSISADSRFVAFASLAGNLVSADTNGALDVFVRDRKDGRTIRVSVSSAGVQGNANSGTPSISKDGTAVAFHSLASNLVPGDANGVLDVFVHDLQSAQTRRASQSSSGEEGNGPSTLPSIDRNGVYVAFQSLASNLVAGDTNGTWDIFVQRPGGEIHRASVADDLVEGNGPSYRPSIAAGLRYVAFQSEASNLVAGDTNGVSDIFVRNFDPLFGFTERVSVDSAGAQGNGPSHAASLSAAGDTVAFQSWASNLVPGDTNSTADIFIRIGYLNETVRASVDSAGVEGNGPSEAPSVAFDGRRVAFRSLASNLVTGDTNGTWDVIYRDDINRTTSLVSAHTAGAQANGDNDRPAISAHARSVAFQSLATNLVPGDGNGVQDVFVHDRLGGTIYAYCTAATNSQGCTPAVAWTGVPSASAGSGFDVSAAGVLNQKDGLLFYGTDGRAASPFHSGTLCVRPPLRRTGIQSSGGNPPPDDCSGAFHFDFNAWIASGADPRLDAGRTVACQYWSRDPADPFGTNLTDALEFTIGP